LLLHSFPTRRSSDLYWCWSPWRTNRCARNARRPPMRRPPHNPGVLPDGIDQRRGGRHPGRIRRVADPAAAHLPGHHGADAGVLCRQPVHLRHGAPDGRAAAHHRRRGGARSGRDGRSAAAGPGVDRHRDRLRHHRAVPGRAARLAGAHRDRPCRRQGVRILIDWLQHAPIYPIAVPLVAGAAMLLLSDSQRGVRAGIAVASCLAQLAAAIALLALAAGAGGHWPNGVGVYLPGDWPAPFGIVLVVDRLAAIMLGLTAVLGLASLIYSLARWDRLGVHFHSLFQFLLMGLNGAFLTGDLFNLFVFFEVLLAASYGLLLHGSGVARVSAGLQYIAVNLVASFLLLISIALIYGVTGTLNLADLAVRAGTLAGSERLLFEAGAAVLGVAFLVKAGAWPLNFWLVRGYGSASAPVAAVFSIMTKVGIYALLRIGSLLLPTGAPAAFSLDWMFAAGLATLVFGAIGLLATQQLEQLVGYCVIVSAGTLLTALGMPGVTLTGPALFYLLSSVLATGAFFMLVELVERTRTFGANVLAVTMDMFDLDDPETPNRSDDVVGVAIPAAMAFLGLAFVSCALLVTGLPPLSG